MLNQSTNESFNLLVEIKRRELDSTKATKKLATTIIQVPIDSEIVPHLFVGETTQSDIKKSVALTKQIQEHAREFPYHMNMLQPEIKERYYER